MQLTRYLSTGTGRPVSYVATIGNFDGVHRGHQTVLKKLLARSQALGLPSMVIAFEPSAKEFFLGSQAPARLTNFREKFNLLRDFGIDRFVCLSFNRTLANMPPETFVRDVLVSGLNIKHLTVGDDFRFGKDRKGDYPMLTRMGDELGFSVENTEGFVVNEERVSSSSIRDHLANGRLDLAEQLLGRMYSMSGRVIHGDHRGQDIGFTTPNIPKKRRFSPISAVFATKVRIEQETEALGVTNVGHRPTVAGTRTQIEVHLFNFSQMLYGKHLTVFFSKKIREEQKFNSLEELKNQIRVDAETAKEHFKIAA
ncbi:MAG: bifunctional riboflavin kinase/FAD synthetase [Proteobacteria bacterium]|nr:bifunctional riboflavin kinase/FAD synthetase [Pseudomonadota bacterium]